jgi:hypothetical protein
MNRALAVVSLLLLGVLIAYVRLSQPGVDQVSAEADSNELPESVVLPIKEVTDEVPLAEANPPVTDTSNVVVREANPENESLASRGVVLEDRMRFVDGIELRSSNEVFEWLLTEEGRDESWAVPMEAELYEYFRAVPYFANNFSVPYIHCRETMCGLQVIGYGQDAAKNGIQAIADMESRSWEGAERLDTRIAMDEIRSDATGFVFYTMRITEETP